MLPCIDCRPQILDHLYGLLDAPEAAAVDAHLASCPACAATRDEAARVQGLFGEAAKNTFPQVRFEPPAAKPRVPALAPVAAPFPKPAARDPRPEPARHNGRRAAAAAAGARKAPSLAARVVPWAVAAAVMLAVPGTVYPVLDLLNKAGAARAEAAEAAAKADVAARAAQAAEAEGDPALRAAEVNLVTARQTHDGLLAKWVADEKAAVQAHAGRKLTWDVFKPAAVQPGAPNEFLVVVRDRAAASAGRVVAEFRNQSDAVIFSQPINHVESSEHPVRLPASAWSRLAPQDELYLVVTRVDEKTEEKTVLQDKVRLLGPVFAAVLTTDKPVYRPGETVRFRSLTLDRVTFTPPSRPQFLQYELRGGDGAPVPTGNGPATLEGGTELVRVVGGAVTPLAGPDGNPVRGVGVGEFTLPPGTADGEYTLVMTETPPSPDTPPVLPFAVTRTLKVRSGAAEAYTKQIGYAGAASYVAGDTVEAWAELKFQNAPVVGAEVRVLAVADDQILDVTGEEAKVTGVDGRASVRFRLPPALERGDVRLKVTFAKHAKGATFEETVADRVPVVGRNLVVEFFPEGGELVAGVPCRVYVRATTPGGHPVDIKGTITDGRSVLARVQTLTDEAQPGANRGIGAFTFTPPLGAPVWLKLDAPGGAYTPLLVPAKGAFPAAAAAAAGVPAVTGSRTGFALPDAKIEGVVMSVPDAVTSPGKPIRVRLWSVGTHRNLVVGAYTRGRLSDTRRVAVDPKQPEEVLLMAGSDPRGGVVRITVFEEPDQVPGEAAADLVPVAERLVFRRPGETLNLNFAAGGPSKGARPEGLAAGSRVDLGLTATDETGNPAAAILYAAAVNTAVASGPRDRLLTTHFLLAGEVGTPDAMEHADFLLTDHPKAAESLDLVLATQGWRRFAEQVPRGFARQPLAATAENANLLVCNGQYMVMAEPVVAVQHRRLSEQYLPRFEQAVKALQAAEAATKAAQADRSAAERVERLAAAASAARAEAGRAQANQAAVAGSTVERFRAAGWYAVAGYGLLAAMLAVASFTCASGRLPFRVGTVGAIGIVAFLVVALGITDRTHAASQEPEAAATAANADRGRQLDVAPTPRERADGLAEAAGKAEGVDKQSSDPLAASGLERQGEPKTKLGAALPPSVFGGFGTGTAGGGGPVGGGVGAAGGGVGFVPAAPQYGGVQGIGVGRRPEEKSGNRTDTKNAAKTDGSRPSGPLPTPVTLPAPATFPDTSLPPGNVPAGTVAPTAIAAPAPPGGAGVRGKTGRDSGWQPLDARRAIPDDSLPQVKEIRLHPSSKVAPGGGLPGRPADGGAALKSVRDAKGDADAYFQAVERAKKYAEDRALNLRSQMQNGLPAPPKPAAAAPAVLGRPGAARSAAEFDAYRRVAGTVQAVPPLVVREYAAPRPGTTERELSLETDTILWQPVIVLPADGKATVGFTLGSAPGGYEVIVAGHTLNGRVGAVRGIIPVSQPGSGESTPPVAGPAGGGPGTQLLPPANVGPNKP